jgi:hypothetical protein
MHQTADIVVDMGKNNEQKENPMNNYPTRIETKTYTNKEGNERSYTVEYMTFPVTIDGETREIEFERMGNDTRPIMSSTRDVFGCRRGQGAKVHRTSATIVFDNGEWVFNWRSGYALNRGDCLIVAFADTVTDARASEHVGTAISKEVK